MNATKTRKNNSRRSASQTTKRRSIARTGKPEWDTESLQPGAFAAKLEGNIGRQIEREFMKGNSLGKIAKDRGLAIGTIRHHFLQYLIEQTYGDVDGEE